MPSPEQPYDTAAVDLRWQDHRAFLVALSAAAGWLDALAFLYLGKVFISFMSGNLLFVGLGAGDGDGGLVLRAGAVLVAFVAGTTIGARITGSELTPGGHSPLTRTLLVESGVLAGFAILWAATGSPAGDDVATLALLVIGTTAMGIQAAVALALHLPNVATVAMTATLAQLGALVGWRAREGRSILARTPAASLMIPLCLAYLVSAVAVAAVPETPAMAFGPLLLLAAGMAAGGGVTAGRTPAPASAPSAR